MIARWKHPSPSLHSFRICCHNTVTTATLNDKIFSSPKIVRKLLHTALKRCAADKLPDYPMPCYHGDKGSWLFKHADL